MDASPLMAYHHAGSRKKLYYQRNGPSPMTATTDQQQPQAGEIDLEADEVTPYGIQAARLAKENAALKAGYEAAVARQAEEIERLTAERDAAIRLERGGYVHWSTAGGPNECAHGRAEGIACPECDAGLIRTVETQ